MWSLFSDPINLAVWHGITLCIYASEKFNLAVVKAVSKLPNLIPTKFFGDKVFTAILDYDKNNVH